MGIPKTKITPFFPQHINVAPVLTPKKKKTPKKAAKFALQSPGGPYTVRTSSFKLMSALPLSMNCINKTHFALDKVIDSYLIIVIIYSTSIYCHHNNIKLLISIALYLDINPLHMENCYNFHTVIWFDSLTFTSNENISSNVTSILRFLWKGLNELNMWASLNERTLMQTRLFNILNQYLEI